MNDDLRKTTLQEYAAMEMAFGQRIINRNSVYWRRVRPFFYRPLLPFVEYSPECVTVPRASFLGGAQHVVPWPEIANSSMNFLMFDDLQRYSSDSLDYNRKRQLRLASKYFVIRPICEVEEFKDKGYKIYLDFLERTHYTYKSERRKQRYFFRWADTLFRFPKVIVLGGYTNTDLVAISVSYLVEDVLIYATFFCTTASLRLHVSDLMLHSIREWAGKSQNIRYIFVGNYHAEKSTFGFYLLRGCKIVKKPALYQINRLTLFFLKTLMPKEYEQLRGHYERTNEKNEDLGNCHILPMENKRNLSNIRDLLTHTFYWSIVLAARFWLRISK